MVAGAASVLSHCIPFLPPCVIKFSIGRKYHMWYSWSGEATSRGHGQRPPPWVKHYTKHVKQKKQKKEEGLE